MNKFTRFFGIILIAFLSATSIQAQDLSIDDILKSYYENIGGEENWKKIENMKMEGSSTMQGMTSPITISAMYPNLVKREINAMGKNLVIAFDGKEAWMINPWTGSEEPQLSGEEASKQMAKEKFQDELIDYKAKGHELELFGTEEINEAEAYKIKMTKKSGDVVFYYLDAEKFIPVMSKFLIGSGPQKGEVVEIHFSEYKKVDGLLAAHKIEQKMGEKTGFSFTAEKVEFNLDDINQSTFDMPKKEEEKKED